MTGQQLKIVTQFNKARQAYFDYACSTMHPSNEHKTAILLRNAEDALIMAYRNNDPLWLTHDYRLLALSSVLRQVGLPESIAAYANYQ